MENRKQEKIWFIQLARALACITIVYVHWITFIFQPNVLHTTIHQQPINNYPDVAFIRPIMSALWLIMPSGFSEAYFALGLFFIISGFVIPLSIGKSPFEFLARRLLRIYPTLIVCLCLVIIGIGVGRWLDHHSFSAFSFKTIWSNFLLVRDTLHAKYIENGTWTLEIELHFYIIFFLLAFFNGHLKPWVLFAVTSLFLGLFHAQLLPQRAIEHVMTQAGFMAFMFVGTCIHNWRYGHWSGKKTVLSLCVLMMLSKYYFSLSDTALHPDLLYSSNLYALVVFFILMLLNDYLSFSKWMDTIANISYPLYLIHGFFGYTVYFIVFKLTASVMLAIIMTTIVVLGLTWLVHLYVEKPCMTASKKIINKLKQLKSLVAENKIVKETN